MMSAANTPFIWLVRLQNRLFGRLRQATGVAANILDASSLIAYTSAVPERIRFSTPVAPFTGSEMRATRGFLGWRGAAN
jgi:hypothetical protein